MRFNLSYKVLNNVALTL